MLRNLPKEQRKKKILDGVEQFILQRCNTDFTMTELAEFIGISPTTFYNIFGTKGTVLFSLINRRLDEIIDCRSQPSASDDPAEYAVYSMTHAAEFFVEKPQLFRSLFKFQLGERDTDARASYLGRGLGYWKGCLQGLVESGYLHDDPSDEGFMRDDVALALMTHSSGVIELWVREYIDDEEFVARMTHDAALIIRAIVPGTDGRKVMAIVKSVRPHIRKFSSLKINQAEGDITGSPPL